MTPGIAAIICTTVFIVGVIASGIIGTKATANFNNVDINDFDAFDNSIKIHAKYVFYMMLTCIPIYIGVVGCILSFIWFLVANYA